MIYKLPSIYNIGNIEQDYENEYIELQLKFLDKYLPKLNVNGYPTYPIKIKFSKLTNLFVWGDALDVITSFYPSYDSSDPVGDYDYPAIAYIELPNYLDYETKGWFFPALIGGQLKQWEVSYFKGTHKIGIRLSKSEYLPIGYSFLYSCSCPLDVSE